MTIRFHYSISKDAWEIFAFDRNQTGVIPYKINMTIERLTEVSKGQSFEPALDIPCGSISSDHVFTSIIDGLAEAGLLKSPSALENELKATKAHLADLQKAHGALLNRFMADGEKPRA